MELVLYHVQSPSEHI